MSYDTLPRAPIREAVLDIWTRLPDRVGADELRAFHDHVRDRYKNVETQRQVSGKFGVRADGATQASTTQEIRGYLFRSADGLDVVQARRDGFSVNRLKPYKDWAKFSTESRRLWELYVEHVAPTSVTKIGLRYINRIELPLPTGELQEYLRTRPELSPELPQQLAGLFMRLVIPIDVETTGVITQAVEQTPKPDPESVPLILDIEVSRTRVYSPESEDLWESLTGLRDQKNHLFFGSITPTVVEWFK